MRAAENGRAVRGLTLTSRVFFGIFVFTSAFSIAASQTSLGITFLLWAVLCVIEPAARPRPLEIALPLGVLLAISAVSSILSSDPAGAFSNMRNYLLFVTVWIAVSLAAESSVRWKLFAVLLVSGAGSSIYGIVIYFMGMGRGSLDRTPGPFSNEMTFGGVLMLLLSLSAAVSAGHGISRRLRSFSAAAAAPAAYALLLTQTRSSWLGMFVSGIVILAVLRRKLLPVFAAAAALAVLFGPAHYRERIKTMFDPSFRTNVQRINMIRGGISILREYPLTGTGPVDLGEIYREHKPPEAVHIHGHMHNIFLQVAVTLGFPGLAAFIWLLVSMFRIMGKNLSLDMPPPDRALAAGCLGAMTGFTVNGLFEWNFGDAEVLALMLLIIGLSAAITAEFAGPDRPVPPDGLS